MRIVHIQNCLRGGGIQNFLLSLTSEQVALGHEVTMIVIEKFDYDYCYHLESIMKKSGVKVICLNKKISNKFSLFQTLLKCRKIVQSLHPDVVNTHGTMSHFYGMYSSMFSTIRQVITVHNAPEKWSGILKMFCKDKPIIFCSQAAYTMRTQESKSMVAIDNGISPNIIRTTSIVDLRKEYNLKETDKIIVCVGSLRPQKNYLFLRNIVDALADKSYHFFICGGNYGTGYVSMDEFKDYPQIHCLGLRSDVAAIENGADLLLSCSKFEGLPIAVLEAYFNGIPCVLSPIPQHMNISNVFAVWIPNEFSANAFVQSIKQALKCNSSHNEIYERRKSQIEQFSITRTAKEYIKFYVKE